MPSLYAHNKFGKLVIAQLPKDVKSIIKKYPESFRIGLQGPDFMFFYKALYKNKVNQLGVQYHHSDTYGFMEHAIEVVHKHGTDSSQYSYILGFICHFTLDNKCHPYVNSSMKTTGCGHVEIEGELDRIILLSDGCTAPQRYRMDKLVPCDKSTALSIAPFFRELDVQTTQECLRWMKRLKRIFVAPGYLKFSFIDALFHLSLHYKKFNGHVMRANENTHCSKEAEQLYDMLKDAVLEAAELIDDFNNALDGDSLTDKFHKDFNGNVF